jgi:sortase A
MNYGDVALGVECAFPRALEFSGKKNFRKKATLWLVALLAVAGALQIGQGLYIHAKAQLAQVLLERAWQRTLAGETAVKPWPWADTWPVARLIAPAQRADLLVLAGANGRSIAFGPGHMDGSPLPGAAGNSVIGGHRDTHLAFLRDVKRGETLTVERADGMRTDYRVTDLDVLDKRDTWVTKNEGPSRLTLITCWPFDALRAGGPQRYVVIAKKL